MFEDVPPVVPPLVATAQANAPAADLPPAGEASMPPPTAEQAQAADHVFTKHVQHHPIATLLGVAASAGMLRDMALDTFDTSDEEEEEQPEDEKDKQQE